MKRFFISSLNKDCLMNVITIRRCILDCVAIFYRYLLINTHKTLVNNSSLTREVIGRASILENDAIL